MIRAKIIDIIRSAVGGVLRIDNLVEYKETYSVGDMTQNTLVPYGLIGDILPQDNIIQLSSGLNPIPLVNGVHFISPSLIPLVLQASEPQYPSVDDTKLTTEGASLRVDYNYSDNTKSVLESIDVWVSDDTIDTWVRII